MSNRSEWFCDAFIPRIETYPEHTWTSRGVRHTIYCLQVAKSRSNSIWGKFLPKARPSWQYQTSFCCKLSNIDYGLCLSDLDQIDLDQISRPIIKIPIDGYISIFDIPTERQRPCNRKMPWIVMMTKYNSPSIKLWPHVQTPSNFPNNIIVHCSIHKSITGIQKSYQNGQPLQSPKRAERQLRNERSRPTRILVLRHRRKNEYAACFNLEDAHAS